MKRPTLPSGTVRNVLTGALAVVAFLGSAAAQTPDPRLEPDVRECQAASLRAARLETSTIDSARSRASLKALAPELEVSGGFMRSTLDEDTINQEYDQNSPWILKASGGDSWEVRGEVTWNFPELVFNAEELDAAGLVTLQEARLREVTRVYFERRRAILALATATDPNARALEELRVEELGAHLDALTGGWFTQESLRRQGRVLRLKQSGPAPVGAPMTAPAPTRPGTTP
ncbi:MAG: hypothetical protein IV100_35140 [Myxococcales bacterium]|nr:hypothetical protein [Myxococcales bacterium]